MLKGLLCLLLAAALVFQLPMETRAASPQDSPQPGAGREGKLEARVLAIPIGAPIGVRLTTGEKVRGEMGEVSREGFTLRFVGGNPNLHQEISFAEPKAIKTIHPSPSLTRPLLKSLLVVGVATGLIALAAVSLH